MVGRLLRRAQEEGRADDNEETIRNRMAVYRRETEPLIAYYPEHGVEVVVVDGSGSIDEVFARIVGTLAAGDEARHPGGRRAQRHDAVGVEFRLRQNVAGKSSAHGGTGCNHEWPHHDHEDA